jgi:hypothetical protein
MPQEDGAIMKRSFVLFGLASLLSLATVHAADSTATADATAAARAWLSAVDTGQYAKSWDEAAAFFKQNVSKADWEKAAGASRQPFGALKTRELESAQPTHELPGAPEGDYVVLTYHASFAGRSDATETVTPMRDADGTWRVAGYFIR